MFILVVMGKNKRRRKCHFGNRNLFDKELEELVEVQFNKVFTYSGVYEVSSLNISKERESYIDPVLPGLKEGIKLYCLVTKCLFSLLLIHVYS